MSNHPSDITVNVSMQLDQSATVVFADINKRVAEQQRKMTAASTKGFADLAKQQKRSADAAIKLNKSVADFKIAADKRAANEAAKAIAKERKAQRDAVKNSVQEHLQAVAQKAAANQAVVDGVLQASEAVVKLGRGFAALGVASEEDVQKITEALDQVQAVMDVAKGSIDTYRGIAGAVKTYQASVTAAATAEKALAAARGAIAAAGGATGVTGAAGAAAPIVAAVAAIASVGVAAKIVHESLTGSAKNIDSWSMKIGTWQAETTEWMGIWSSGSEKVKAALDKLNGERAGNVRREEVGRIQTSGRFAQEDIARESLGNRVSSRDDPAAKDQALTNQAFLVEKQRGSARVSARFGKTESERGLGKNAALKLSNELIGIETQRLGIAKQVRSEKVAAAKAGVQGAQKELELSKQRLDQLKGSLQSAKERFGQLTPEQQDELKAIMAKAQRNEDLTIEESGKLRSVGTEQARTFAEKSDLGRAKMGKFDESFGSSERGDIANEEGRQKTLAINVQTKKDIQIKVQRENDAFVTGLADFINQEIEKLDRELEAKVQKIVEEKMEVLAKTPNEQLENRYRSGGQPSV